MRQNLCISTIFILFLLSCRTEPILTDPNNSLNLTPFSVTVQTRTDTSAKLVWTKSVHTSGAAVLYKVYLQSTLVAQTLTDTTFNLSQLLPNTNYPGRVVAYVSPSDSFTVSFQVPATNTTPVGPYGYLSGYYKVTEYEYDLNNRSDENRLVFTGRVQPIIDSMLGFYQHTRIPTTWWSVDYSSIVHPELNDSLFDNSSVRGRILDSNTIRIKYAFGNSTTVFYVEQLWERLSNPADSNQYAYQWPVPGPGMITTVAGNYLPNGSVIPAGDGGSALNATLTYPRSIYVDENDVIYIGEGMTNHAIRRVSSSGIISTFAGNHTEGFSGDNGPANQAQLFYASGMTSDNNGNVYISDMGNRRIRKVNSAGIISTFAGTGQFGYLGDGYPASISNIGGCTDLTTGPDGNLYFIGGSRVLKIDMSTLAVISVAGTGVDGISTDGGLATASSLYQPSGICFDPSGNLYIANKGDNRVRKVNTNGIISTFAGKTLNAGWTGDGGPATDALIYGPYDVASDAQGNIYISGASVIRKVNTAGIISRFAGNYNETTWSISPYFFNGDHGPAISATIPGSYGITVRNNKLYLVDARHRVRMIQL